VVAHSKIEPGELDPRGRDRVYTRLSFASPHDASARTFTLRITSPDGVPDSAWSLVGRKDFGWMVNRATWRHDGQFEPPNGKWHEHALVWQTRQAGRVIDGQLAIDLHYGLQHFRAAGSIGPYSVYEYRDALSRYHTVSRAYVVYGERQAMAAVRRPAFDPVHAIVLDRPGEGEPSIEGEGDGGDETPVEILREDNGHIALQAARTAPGWLVISQAWFPGWKAHVNGVETPIVRANYAFGAVKIGAGASRIELDYEPKSLLVAAVITLSSALACAGWLFFSARAARIP